MSLGYFPGFEPNYITTLQAWCEIMLMYKYADDDFIIGLIPKILGLWSIAIQIYIHHTRGLIQITQAAFGVCFFIFAFSFGQVRQQK